MSKLNKWTFLIESSTVFIKRKVNGDLYIDIRMGVMVGSGVKIVYGPDN